VAKLTVGVNDLSTLHPELAAQADGWDPTQVTTRSGLKLSWMCQLGHAWEARVADRTTKGRGCPYCSNQKVLPGFNDLASSFPDLAIEADGWDPTTVTVKTHKKLPWKCSQGHRWEAVVASRTPPSNCGCPVCAGKVVLEGLNDLASIYPEVASEADGWDPRQITAKSNKKLPWRCVLGHTWAAVVASRTPPLSNGCPYCSNQKILPGFNDLKTRYPELAKEAFGWDPTKVSAGTTKKLSWQCQDGHIWTTSPSSRTSKTTTGCPSCAKYGFKQAQEAWLYLLERPGEQQLGVTNNLEERLQKHGQKSWTEIEVIGPFPGEKVLATERDLKQWLRNKVGLIPGTHENWTSTSLEVRSFAELKARSGVETDLF
jgi:hypothetical protein